MKLDVFLKTALKSRALVPYFVLGASLLLTAGATYYTAITAQAKDRLRFENAVQRTQDNIQTRLETYIAFLQAGSGLFAASEQVSRDEFGAYVNRLDLPRRYPGIQGIGFSRRVMPWEKEAAIADMQQQGWKNFTIKPGFKRSEYHPIVYLEPLDRRNRAAIGFDMFTEPVRRAAMERARDTGLPAASGKVTLVQEIDPNKQAGFLIYVPIYRNKTTPTTVAQRRATLQGFIYSPFRVTNLLIGIFRNQKDNYLDFQVYDGSELNSQNLFYASSSPNAAHPSFRQPRFRKTTTLEIAGRPWRIAFVSRPPFEQLLESNRVPSLALGGLLISFILFGVTRSQAFARITAERAAAELRLSEAALRQNEERYRAFIEQSSEGIWRFELEKPISIERPEDEQIEHFYQYCYLAECNDVVAQMYGFERAQDLVGARLEEFLVRSNPQNIEYLRAFIRSGYRLNDAESHELDKQGNSKYFLNNLVGIVEKGCLIRAWGTQRDISEAKRLEEIRQQAEVALQRSESQIRLIADAVPALISYVDTEQRYRFNNQGYENWFGRPRTEVYGKHLREVLGEAAYESVKPYVEAVLSGQEVSYEQLVPYKDAGNRYIHAACIPDFDEQGQVRGYVALIQDITQQKQAENALRESREQLELVFAAARFGMWNWNVQTGKVIWSEQHERLFGLEPGRFGGTYSEFKERIHPEDVELVAQAIARSMQEKTEFAAEYRVIWPDGSVRWIAGRGRFFHDEQGQPLRMTGAVMDITRRKQAETELRYSEAKFRRLAQSNIIGTMIAAYNGKITEANDAFLQMVGYTREELHAGKICWTEMTPPEYQPQDEQIWQEIKQTGVCNPFEKEYIRKDGSRVPILIAGALLEGSQDTTICFVLDLSDRKRAELEREQLLKSEQAARAEAETANRMKDEFLATLSHELRTPLNAMLGWTTLLRTRKFDEATTARALETIDRNTKSLAQLIEDVLDVSRIITGKLHLDSRPVNLVTTVAAALDTLRPAAAAKSIDLKFLVEGRVMGSRGDGETRRRGDGEKSSPHSSLFNPSPITHYPSPITVLGDANRLQQIIWNLLSNAVKFTPAGGRVEVELEALQMEPQHSKSAIFNLKSEISYAQITVKDTGKGISADFLPHVFERFRQADSSSTRSHGGLGLGLAIVRHLVELHGGTVTAQSPGLGQGATFTVKLPLLEVRSEERGVKKNELESYSSSLTGIKVLVVDDEADAREFLAIALSEYGADVTAVASTREALDALHQLQPNILVSDIGMPEEDGYALIRKIRTLDTNRGGQIPAIALTAYARTEDQTKALLAGFQLHVPKPVNPAELAVVVANLVGRKDNRTV